MSATPKGEKVAQRMAVGQTWRARHSGRRYVVLWMGDTEAYGGDSPVGRCLLAAVNGRGEVQEDTSWDWVDRIEERWTLLDAPPAADSTEADDGR